MQGSLKHCISDLPMRDYLCVNLERRQDSDEYGECEVAQQLDARLRLVAKYGTIPMAVYPQARIIRHAAFTNVGLQELDFPASHGQQAYKYAIRHTLNLPILEEAFGNGQNIINFRKSLPLPYPKAKDVINQIVGGSGLVKVASSAGVSELPIKLKSLHLAMSLVRKHMSNNCSSEWLAVLKDRDSQYPLLTLASWHFQKGERADIDVVTNALPEGVQCFGWLGDSLLTGINFDAPAFCGSMEQVGIYMGIKSFPNTMDRQIKK